MPTSAPRAQVFLKPGGCLAPRTNVPIWKLFLAPELLSDEELSYSDLDDWQGPTLEGKNHFYLTKVLLLLHRTPLAGM